MKQYTEWDAVLKEVVAGIYKAYPQLLEKYGERGRQKCWEDNLHHMKHLETAYALRSDKPFIEYAHWLDRILTSRGMHTDHLIDNFERIDSALSDVSSEDPRIAAFRSMLGLANASLRKNGVSYASENQPHR